MTKFNAHIDYNPGTGEYDYNETPEWENGIPFSVYHRREIRFDLPSGRQYIEEEILEWFNGEFGSDVEKLRDGYTVEWDGNNHVGDWEDEEAAGDIRFAIDEKLRDAETSGLLPCRIEWDCADWYLGGLSREDSAAELKITANTTDEQLVEISKGLGEDQDGPGGERIVLTDVDDFLESLRQHLIEEDQQKMVSQCKYCGHEYTDEDLYVCQSCGAESCTDCAGRCGCDVEVEDEVDDRVVE